MRASDVSVVIPTCERGAVLLDTLEQLLALASPAREILVMDQTRAHPPPVARALERLAARGAIAWHRLARRSITAAMNRGAALAAGEVLLFLDDDVRLTSEIVREHARAYDDPGMGIVAGQVVQPWQRALPPSGPVTRDTRALDPDGFAFNACTAQPVRRFPGGNVSLRRRCLLELGGFDENFAGAAYRFEADLAERAHARGLVMRFEPRASLDHLKAASGGTRVFGDHLRSVTPWHSMGRYYYLLLHPRVPGVLRRTLREAAHAVAAREHLRRPWWIPLCAVAELAGLLVAVAARLRGPRLTLSREGAR